MKKIIILLLSLASLSNASASISSDECTQLRNVMIKLSLNLRTVDNSILSLLAKVEKKDISSDLKSYDEGLYEIAGSLDSLTNIINKNCN